MKTVAPAAKAGSSPLNARSVTAGGGVAAKQTVPPESVPPETVTVPSGPRRTRSWSFALPSFSHLGSASAGGTQTAWSRMVDGDPTAGKRVARSPAARMEPKTFFANERTFTSWLSAGMLLLSVGIAITELEDDMEDMDGHTVNSVSSHLQL